jgi:hypothetical protein
LLNKGFFKNKVNKIVNKNIINSLRKGQNNYEFKIYKRKLFEVADGI